MLFWSWVNICDVCDAGLYNMYHPYPAEIIYLNFKPLQIVSRYRDPQPQVVEN